MTTVEHDIPGKQSEVVPALPHPSLRALDRLVGTWDASGPDSFGRVAFAWLEGGFFLTQQVDFTYNDTRHRGIEYIGHNKDNDCLTSRYFGDSEGVLEYVWEIEGDTLTIWFGEKDSPAFHRGQFTEDGDTNSGRWQWPGGGYESTMTRMPTTTQD